MELQNAKGTRDFPPEEKILRNEIVRKLQKAFERYGFNPIETPVIERYDVLSAKFAGGEEILKEVFRLTDQGKRELALRYDLTVPFARYVGMNPSLKMPFKRYQIEKVFRDGPIKLGRYREFYQCDVDIVGIKSVAADAELLSIMEEVFSTLQMDVVIQVNSRKVLDALMEKSDIVKEKRLDVILVLDKSLKIGMDGVEKELQQKGIAIDLKNSALSFIFAKGTNEEKIGKLKELLGEESEAVKEIQELFRYVKEMGLTNVSFEPSLARGLGYYTGPVFEAFLKESEVKSACAGGGRYDNMIGGFLESKTEYPAVGVSFGLEVILDYMKLAKRKMRKSIVDVYVVPIKMTCFDIVNELRKNGVNADVDLQGKGISKNLDFADKYGIPYVIIVGEEEKKLGKVQFKDMISGNQELMTVAEAIGRIRKK